jgi:outer membrane receptor protein involved in Fe transport
VFSRRDHLEEAAVYGELTYDLAPRLTATVGGRLFASRVRTVARDFEISRAPPSAIEGSLTDTGFSPKVRLSYAFRPDTVIYLQAQDGFRTGGFNVPAQADGMTGGPDVAAYRPDRLRNFEAGGEASVLHGALTVRLAAYLAQWRDVQTDQFRASGLPVTLNIGDGRNSGVEFEAAWRPNAHWRIHLNGLVNDPELTRTSDAFLAKVDIGLPGVAKLTGAFDVAYGWNIAPDWRAELALQGAYIGRSFLTFDGGSASKMGGYAQVRLAGSLQSADWRLDAYVDNLTDEAGNTFAFGNPFSRARARQATPLPPRTFGLAIRRSF